MQSNAQWLTIEADSIYLVNVSNYLSVTVTQTKHVQTICINRDRQRDIDRNTYKYSKVQLKNTFKMNVVCLEEGILAL